VHQAGGFLEGGQIEQGGASGRKRTARRALIASIAKEAAMAITVDSSQWTGQPDETPLAVPVVWGEFENEAARDVGRARLIEAGAHDPATSGSAAATAPPTPAANQDQVGMPDEHPAETGRRNVRQNVVGIAMAGSAMAAAGLIIATGGAALPAVAAAAAAGAVTGAAGEAIGTAVDPGTEAAAPPSPPAAEGPLIGLQAPDAESRLRAEAALRAAGARRVFVQERRGG
jgi:hypothetical protein